MTILSLWCCISVSSGFSLWYFPVSKVKAASVETPLMRKTRSKVGVFCPPQAVLSVAGASIPFSVGHPCLVEGLGTSSQGSEPVCPGSPGGVSPPFCVQLSVACQILAVRLLLSTADWKSYQNKIPLFLCIHAKQYQAFCFLP